MRHVVSLLVENHQGVLSRIARLFDGRGYALESLRTSAADESGVARITIVVRGPRAAVDKVGKQLDKLVDVIEVEVVHDAVMAE